MKKADLGNNSALTQTKLFHSGMLYLQRSSNGSRDRGTEKLLDYISV